MAEFGYEWIYGDLPSEDKAKEVTAEMLEFTWIEQCKDVDTLKVIVARLSTGEEKGLYPELTAVAKKCLWDILPNDIKRRSLTVGKEPSENEKFRATQELLAFQNKFGSSHMERLEKQTKITISRSSPPPVRGSATQKKDAFSILKQEELQLPRSEEKKSSQALSGYDYEAWERLDTDAMEKDLERDDEQEDFLISLSLDNRKAGLKQEELQQLQDRLGVKAYTPMERRCLTVREACKAKECHKAKEYEQALYHYERAIAFDFENHHSASLHHSRAATYVALNSLQAAENDTDTSLYYCNTNPDLWMRRAVIRAKRGRHENAIKDLDKVLLLDPKNETAIELRKKCLEMHEQQEGERLGFKEVLSKKFDLDKGESSRLDEKRQHDESATNINLLVEDDTQSDHVNEARDPLERNVSFSDESGPGDFVLEDVIKYEKDKLLRASNKDLTTTFRRHVAHFGDGSEPGEHLLVDDLKYEENRMYESLHPDIAKSKYVHSSDGNLEVATPPSTSSGEKISSELERGKEDKVVENTSSMTEEEDHIKSMMIKDSHLNNEEEAQWKSIPINFDDNSSDDGGSSSE